MNLKKAIYCFVFIFCVCSFISERKLLADSVEEDNCYTAEIAVKYFPSIDISTSPVPIKSQLYEIVDGNGNVIAQGNTNNSGIINFQYEDLSYTNSISVRVKIIAENNKAIVNRYDENTNLVVENNYFVSDEIIIFLNQNIELEIVINSDDTNHDLICISQNALYAYEFFKNNYQDVLIANGEVVDDIEKINILMKKYERNSAFVPNPMHIRINTINYGIMVHEYAHYFDHFYGLSAGESMSGHNLYSFNVDKIKDGNNSGLKHEINNMKRVITEGFASFCQSMETNVLSSEFEICDDYGGGELLEYTFVMILNDLIDNTPNEDNICISFFDIIKIMKACYEQSQDYVLYDFLEYIVDNQIATRDDINHLININYVTQTSEIIAVNGINCFKMRIYGANYKGSVNDFFNVFNIYYLRVYEKTNNGYIELEEFQLDYVNTEIIQEGTAYYCLFPFSIELRQLILNNNFKELYYNMEQINVVEGYGIQKTTEYVTDYKPIELHYDNLIDININYINDTNNYMWIAYEAPVESNYTIYSSGLADVMCMVYRDRMDLNSLITGNDNLDGDNQNFLVNTYLSQGEKVYLKIIFVYNMTNTTIHIRLNYNEYLLIDSEKFILHGTEVRLNNGILNGTTITQGLSRIAYIPTGNWPSSRLDYHWFSSDESVATVSEYGTIQALSVDEQKTIYITAICKNNSAISFIQEITVVPDTSNIKRTINLTISIPDNGGFKIIELNSSCPNPLIGSYTWDRNDNLFEISGTKLIRKCEGNFIVRGEYKYNKNYEVIITVTE